ncbi:hypothetical protein [Thiohalocapsa sp. ML1]|jgi:hypothetical protein|uniref:hypothetical protein n=1 Tax=Thiohalocapsa sp. ML1 TaxID=1431688 RepID=UPI000731F675|nr:hypothetical protein [Thiohalocapsa sp. ML1]
MQDQERFEQLENNLREAAETEAQYDVIRQRLEALDRDSARLLMEHVLPIYQAWQPQVGDVAFFVDALEGVYFPVVVREVLGRFVRAQATSAHHTAFYSVTLDKPIDYYERANCMLPAAAFEHLRDHLPLRLAPYAQ